MKLRLQPNAWSCLPAAFAMALGVLPKDIIEYCGHDGSEILWPDLPEPKNRRAFGLHEMIDYCVGNLVYPVEITASVAYGVDEEHLIDADGISRLDWYMGCRSGVLIGMIDERPHAVAWNFKKQLIYDPDGLKYGKERFNILSFFALF